MKKIITSILVYTLFITSLYGQQALEVGFFKIGTRTYEVFRSVPDSTFLIDNMDKSELLLNPLSVNGLSTDLADIKMTNYAALKDTVIKALGKKKVEELAREKMSITGWIYYRGDGTVINGVFKVPYNANLTLDDIARIEAVLQDRFVASFESLLDLHLSFNVVQKDYQWNF